MKRFGLMHTLRKLYDGQSIARIYMNYALAEGTLTGRVLDVGGGRAPDYFNYLQRNGPVEIVPIDASLHSIDFEKDALPCENNSIDTVLLCNVLEHIYNHQFLLKEIHRVLVPGARLIGFVPFWVGYHPDPHDYFRYTHEALLRMLGDADFIAEVTNVGGGPLLANFNTLVLSMPRVVRPLAFLVYTMLNAMFVYIRPGSAVRQPLGFVFIGEKQ
jgi:SAM-dependent methyltransferase